MTSYKQKMTEAYQQVRERELTPTELKRREEIAKKLPLKDFEKRYGKEKGMQVKMGVATKMAKAEMKEDGHSDVSSMIRKCKTVIEDANEIMSKLNSMDKEGSLPTWWTNKLAVASNSMNKMRDYILNPIEESVIMEKEGDLEDMKKVVAELKGASKKHLSQAVRIDRLDLKNETLDTICDELRAASKMHLGQSKRVQSHIGMMEGDATDAAKELINREKERMKDKHDTIMQRAKIKDVTDASREKQGEN
tara:strand:- start:25 stop:774 length:750 start_codon:yes stop_codon:yes gene_type:complete